MALNDISVDKVVRRAPKVPKKLHMSPKALGCVSLLQHASTITDSRLCCWRCDTEELINLVPADGGTHKSPMNFYSRYSRNGLNW